MEIVIQKDIPIEKVELDVFNRKHIEVYLQRDDLLHKDVSGNKWRKLKYALKDYDRETYDGILSFGGAFSNHLAATAAACHLLDIPFVAFVRGEKPNGLNSTLAFIESSGAKIEWLNRTDFKELRDKGWPNPDLERYSNFMVIPEGGRSDLAIKSCEEITENWEGQAYDFACCSIGTGTTFSGLVNSLTGLQTKCLGFVMLKDQGYLTKEIEGMTTGNNYELIRDYHFNGFGKVTDELIDFLNRFYEKNKIPLDPIYTGKMMYGIANLAENDFFPVGSKIIAIHTGGLQGIKGCNEQRRKKNKSILEYSIE